MNVVQLREPEIETKKSSFDEFWAIYPRHLNRFKASKAWEKLSDEEKKEALSTISAHVRYWRSKEVELEYIPHGATWINQHRWEDELETKKPALVSVCGKCGRELSGYTFTQRWGKTCDACYAAR